MNTMLMAAVAGLCCYHTLNHADISVGNPFPTTYGRPSGFALASLLEAAVHTIAAVLVGRGGLRVALTMLALLHVVYVPWMLLFTSSFRRHLNDFTTRRVRFDDRLGIVRRAGLAIDVATHGLATVRLAMTAAAPWTSGVVAIVVGVGLFWAYRRAAIAADPCASVARRAPTCAKMPVLAQSAQYSNARRPALP